MSMHEIEALTEASIRLLDRTEGLDHRSMFKSLYDFEGAFDTGFTRLRLLDILLKRRFAYRMALEDHPDYAQFKDALEGIRKQDFSHIERDPLAEWDCTANPTVAYWSEGHLYCEAGSEIWTKLSELGRFSGADCESPQPIDIVDMADTVVSLAIAKGDKELAAWWYGALPVAIFWETSSRRPVSAPDDLALQRIRDAVVQSEAYKIKTDWGCLCYPERDGDMVNESGPDEVRFLQWWFEPLWSASSNTLDINVEVSAPAAGRSGQEGGRAMTSTQILDSLAARYLGDTAWSGEDDAAIVTLYRKRSDLIAKAPTHPYRPGFRGMDDEAMDGISEATHRIVERPARARIAFVAKLDVIMDLIAREENSPAQDEPYFLGILKSLCLDVIARERAKEEGTR